MTDLDEEAKRLAAAHPFAGTGATETHTTDWQPQHAVPRHRKPAPMSDIDRLYIERRVAADLARIDRELAAVPTMDELERTLAELDWYARDRTAAFNTPRTMTMTNAWPGVLDWFAQNWQDAYAHVNLGVQIHDDFDTIDATQWSAIRRHAEKLARLDATYGFGTADFLTQAPRYRTPKQRTPKTYVAPGRKAGRTWIARLEQSKQARKR